MVSPEICGATEYEPSFLATSYLRFEKGVIFDGWGRLVV